MWLRSLDFFASDMGSNWEFVHLFVHSWKSTTSPLCLVIALVYPEQLCFTNRRVDPYLHK